MRQSTQFKIKLGIITAVVAIVIAVFLWLLYIPYSMQSARNEFENNMFVLLSRVYNGEEARVTFGEWDVDIRPSTFDSIYRMTTVSNRRGVFRRPKDNILDHETSVKITVGDDVCYIVKSTEYNEDFIFFTFKGKTTYLSYERVRLHGRMLEMLNANEIRPREAAEGAGDE